MQLFATKSWKFAASRRQSNRRSALNSLDDSLRHDAYSREAALDRATMAAQRIVSADASDPRSKSFDMLRTQVVQAMAKNDWQTLAITSPTPGCGKTLTAINLALSIARHPERSVVLVDLDLQKPQIARRLGIKSDAGVLGVLEGRLTVQEAVVRVRADRYDMLVLPAEVPTAESSEWMASLAMADMLQAFRDAYPDRTIILDLPPMLVSDDVIAVLPRIDCALLVSAVGTSTLAEIEECTRYLKQTNVVRMVVNKVPEAAMRYY